MSDRLPVLDGIDPEDVDDEQLQRQIIETGRRNRQSLQDSFQVDEPDLSRLVFGMMSQYDPYNADQLQNANASRSIGPATNSAAFIDGVFIPSSEPSFHILDEDGYLRDHDSFEDTDTASLSGLEEDNSGNSDSEGVHDWDDPEDIVPGRLELRRQRCAGRTMLEMFRVQAQACLSKINTEATYDLEHFQTREDLAVELEPGDEDMSFQELWERFFNIDLNAIVATNDWYHYRHGSPSYADIRKFLWFFQSSTVPLLVQHREPRNLSTNRVDLPSSVLNIGGSSSTTRYWCPCHNLTGRGHAQDGKSRLLKTFCKVSRTRRHCLRRLYEEVYEPQSRGRKVMAGLEVSLYGQYHTAGQREASLRSQWFDRQKGGPGEPYKGSEAADFDYSDLECGGPIDELGNWSGPSPGRTADELLQRFRFAASSPDVLWPHLNGMNSSDN